MSNEQQGDDPSIAIGKSVEGSAVVLGDNNRVAIKNTKITKITQVSPDKIKSDPLITASPYKGLKPFEPKDSDRFFWSGSVPQVDDGRTKANELHSSTGSIRQRQVFRCAGWANSSTSEGASKQF